MEKAARAAFFEFLALHAIFESADGVGGAGIKSAQTFSASTVIFNPTLYHKAQKIRPRFSVKGRAPAVCDGQKTRQERWATRL
jgi:hypothetical protein